jgi:type I restriction enzyme, R subunit
MKAMQDGALCIMESRNFEFLRGANPELADLGGFAERYTHSDPASALVKLRLFGEQLTSAFHMHYALPRPPKARFLDLLENDAFESSVPAVVRGKLHALRSFGNRAAHGTAEIDPGLALHALKEAFDLARWFGATVQAKPDVQQETFQEPPSDLGETKGRLKREKKEALQRLAAQEGEMQRLLERLDAEHAKAAAAEKTREELEAIMAQTNQAANALHFSEEETRALLIDAMLVQAGWNVASGDQSTDEVRKEFEVQHQPTDSGLGYADYVLFDNDEKPLAVIEAKKTAHHSEKGRAQAKCYADGLEKMYGQRPVVFYTNGFDIFIWDDAKGEVPRKLYGFYSKNSLRYAHWRGSEQQPRLADLGPDSKIIDRPYQILAVKQVCEDFDRKRRKALVVQATGTGKTRVAIGLSELLIRAHRVKRILFLCDRRELRKQAHNAYKQFLEAEPRTYVTSRTNEDRNQTVYLATYPAMMKCFQNFDVGFFDLVIADESHRSIYNRYRDLFLYFDALQVGLTATPVKAAGFRNTFRMFLREDGDPTAHYSYTDAIEDTPPSLVPFHVTKHTTKFLREGLSYERMTAEERAQADEQVEDSELIDYTKEQVSKEVFNKDTDRKILRNLMENGLPNPDGTHVGKTIVFARNHQHAIQLQRLFEEMYPQYMQPKREFCAVIDNYVDRAEQLIDDFKNDGNNDNLHIAISVDMLDTGIDVPEVVNLVFAKPVKSYVKFWQMIGRGTRLCKGLFIDPETGKRKDKECFQIFDHWGNFEYFGENPPEYEPTAQKSLMQRVFEARVTLAELALEQQNLPVFEMATDLLEKDVRALPDNTIAIREKWRQVKTVQQDGAIRQFDAAMVGLLRMEIAPLMQWRNLEGHEDAYRFDWLVAKLQRALLARSGEFDDLKGDMQEQVGQLPVNLGQVAAKVRWIDQVKNASFWTSATVEGLEEVRRELRGIMHCRNKPTVTRPKPLELDITDSEEESERQIVRLDGLDLAAYRVRVESVLKDLFAESPALQKIKAGRPVTEQELRDLIEKVMLREPDLKVDDLLVHFPNTANRLDLAIRQVIGLDAEAVNTHFTRFVQKYPGLSSHQIRFLELIKKHVAQYGVLQLDKLYETPFTQIHSQGVEGVFTDEGQIDDLITLIGELNEAAPVPLN